MGGSVERRPYLTFDPLVIPGYDRLEDAAWKASREESRRAKVVAETIPGGRLHIYHTTNPQAIETIYEQYRVAAAAAERARGLRDQCYDAYSEYLDDDYEVWVDRED
jgi:hypothetical protein